MTKQISNENSKENTKENSKENPKENTNDAFRYSKMSEQQAENIYQERFFLILH